MATTDSSSDTMNNNVIQVQSPLETPNEDAHHE